MALSFLLIWHKPNTKLVIQSYLFFSTPPISPTIFPHNKHTKLPFNPKIATPPHTKKIKPQASEMLHYAKHHASENRRAIERSGSVDKCWGHRNKKHKKQPFGDASASHLSLVLWHVWFQAEAWISHPTSPTPPSYDVGGIAKRIKTARLRRKTKPGRDVILHVRP